MTEFMSREPHHVKQEGNYSSASSDVDKMAPLPEGGRGQPWLEDGP